MDRDFAAGALQPGGIKITITIKIKIKITKRPTARG